jgi:alkanesulfonate monooxygenase SsuD/methylene tetrahydromethanopterin reductase-like flavin-dependent oxidoreductase (luciferase family)
MKLGIYLSSQHRERGDPARRLAETLEHARMIRALGFDSIRVGEHQFVPGFDYFPRLPLC